MKVEWSVAGWRSAKYDALLELTPRSLKLRYSKVVGKDLPYLNSDRSHTKPV